MKKKLFTLLWVLLLSLSIRGEIYAVFVGIITANELFDFVHPKVKERTNESQIPVMWGKFDKSMIILKLNK